jgi:hypothetical protein
MFFRLSWHVAFQYCAAKGMYVHIETVNIIPGTGARTESKRLYFLYTLHNDVAVSGIYATCKKHGRNTKCSPFARKTCWIMSQVQLCVKSEYHSNKLIDTNHNQIVSKRMVMFICKYDGHMQKHEKASTGIYATCKNDGRNTKCFFFFFAQKIYSIVSQMCQVRVS